MGSSNSKKDKNKNATPKDAQAVHKRDKKGKTKQERPASMGATLDFPTNFGTRPNPEGDISGRRPAKFASTQVSSFTG